MLFVYHCFSMYLNAWFQVSLSGNAHIALAIKIYQQRERKSGINLKLIYNF